MRTKLKRNPVCVCRPLSAANQNGVALIVVLGLLSVLLITAVSFAIFMRIERSGAANFRHGTSARHMLQVGLSRAIEDINLTVGDAPYADFDRAVEIARQYDPDDSIADVPFIDHVLASYDFANPDGAPTARVLSVAAMAYVPRALREAVHAVSRPRDPPVPALCHFKPVIAQNEVVGRYGYIVLNLSGLLDANKVGDADFERGVGGDPREIRLTPDLLADVADPDVFAADRATHQRYETLPELKQLNTGLNAGELTHFALYSRDPVPENFDERAYIGEDRPRWVGPMTTQNSDNIGRIMWALHEAGVPNYQVLDGLRQHHIAYLGMCDYTDPGLVPVGDWDLPPTVNPQTGQWTAGGPRVTPFAYPSIKPVPKLSSLAIAARYTRESLHAPGDPPQYRHTIQYGFVAGAAVPYSAPPPGQYALRFRFKMTGENFNVDPDFNGLVPLHKTSDHPDYALVFPAAEDPLTFTAAPSADTQLYRNTQMDREDLHYVVENDKPYPTMTFVLRAGAEVRQRPAGGGPDRAVDRAPAAGLDAPDADGIRVAVMINQDAIDEAGGPDGATLFYWSETFDPRFNWDNRLWVDGLILQMNKPAGYPDPMFSQTYPTWLLEQYLNADYAGRDQLANAYGLPQALEGAEIMDAVPGVDNVQAATRMVCALRPFDSVGELGYMLIGPWTSIKLHNFRVAQNPAWQSAYRDYQPPHRVLDHFTLLDAAEAVTGRVNINTPLDNILASVYYRMPLRELFSGAARAVLPAPQPGEPNQPPGNAGQVEQVFRAWRYPDDEPPRYFRALSDMGMVFEGDTGEALNSLIAQRIAQGSLAPINQLNDFDRDAIIRNASGLFTTRHQLYLVILRADAFTPRFGMTDIESGTVLSTGHAVALVWRDTRPDPNDPDELVHPTQVRLFQVLDP